MRTALLFFLAACSTGAPTKADGTTSGADGTDGTDGTDGSDGTDGTDGTDGSDGTDGDSGGPDDPRLALAMAAPAHATTDDFSSPEVCADCHSNAATADAMRLPDGTGVSPYDLQHGTMMANAGRDPLFWAVLSAEQAQAPALADEITDTCLRCHAPMARWDAHAAGEATPSPAALRAGGDDRTALGLDGVSCTTCHRIDPTDLDAPAALSGNYQIADNQAMYGPHADPFTDPMEHHTGFTPTEGDHMLDSGLCASCHTLQTHTVADGAATGATYLEQGPWLEWRNSGAAAVGTSCQDCHMPPVDAAGEPIETAIARNPGGRDFPIDPRQPFGQHVMVGGNAFMLGVLRDNRDVLQPRASDAVFDDQIARTRAFLTTAATVTLEELRRTEDGLQATVVVNNHTGHKLPTAYPSRRAWLELVVTDATGAEVFHSGGVDSAGRLVDESGSPLASELAGGPTLPHRTTVTAADEVQVYQTVMADGEGSAVYRLLHAAQSTKDNRILPAGWGASTTATEVGDIGPVGTDSDPDYAGSGGSDRVLLALDGLSGPAPHTVTATLRYQAYAPRHAAELALVDTPEVAALMAMLETAAWAPETLATAAATLD